MTDPLRVAIFTETFLPKMDGIVRVLCLLLDHLHDNNVETLIVAPKLGSVDRYRSSRILQIDGIPLPMYPELKFCAPAINTYRAVQDFQPDVIHVVHPLAIGVTGMMMAKRLNVPTVASFHIDFVSIAEQYNYPFMCPIIEYVTKTMFNWADCTLAPSRAMQDKLHKMGIDDVKLWQRGVDAQTFHPDYANDAMRERLTDGHPDETLLLFVGRLATEKRIHTLRHILEQVPRTRLAIVGEGPQQKALQQHFAGTNTVFTGYLRGEELSQAYASADIFTFPSGLESFGLVVVEAMAAGLPVVAARVGGIPDVVDEGVTGYTFDVGDTDAMVAGVRRIAGNRERIQQMGTAARAYAETQTWAAMMDEVIALYQQLAQTKQRISHTA